jgi:archaellum component FlaC
MIHLYKKFLQFYWSILGIDYIGIAELNTKIEEQKRKIEKIMTSLETLQLSIATLTSTVDAVVTDLNTPHPTEAQVLAAAEAINAQVTRLNTALEPAVVG